MHFETKSLQTALYSDPGNEVAMDIIYLWMLILLVVVFLFIHLFYV